MFLFLLTYLLFFVRQPRRHDLHDQAYEIRSGSHTIFQQERLNKSREKTEDILLQIKNEQIFKYAQHVKMKYMTGSDLTPLPGIELKP